MKNHIDNLIEFYQTQFINDREFDEKDIFHIVVAIRNDCVDDYMNALLKK